MLHSAQTSIWFLLTIWPYWIARGIGLLFWGINRIIYWIILFVNMQIRKFIHALVHWVYFKSEINWFPIYWHIMSIQLYYIQSISNTGYQDATFKYDTCAVWSTPTLSIMSLAFLSKNTSINPSITISSAQLSLLLDSAICVGKRKFDVVTWILQKWNKMDQITKRQCIFKFLYSVTHEKWN